MVSTATMLEDAKHLDQLEAAAASEAALHDLAALARLDPCRGHASAVHHHGRGGVTLLFDQDDTLPEPAAPWQLTHPEELPTGSSATADSR
jgi:hypothetical protein